jgi:hypothetical protein
MAEFPREIRFPVTPEESKKLVELKKLKYGNKTWKRFFVDLALKSNEHSKRMSATRIQRLLSTTYRQEFRNLINEINEKENKREESEPKTD